MMCNRYFRNAPYALTAVLLCLAFGCHGDTPYWKDEVTRQAIDFLKAQGITVRRLVVSNAGGFELDLRGSSISNLTVLEGMPLDVLLLSNTSVHDLSPLREMRFIRKLDVANTAVIDLSPLKDLQLSELTITKTKVADLSPLEKMPLRVISFVKTEVSDLTPLRFLPLQEAYFSAEATYQHQSIQILRTKDSLRCINYYGSVAEFWKDYDAGKFNVAPAD